jgi:protein N-terminal asparagine amidohydrolase
VYDCQLGLLRIGPFNYDPLRGVDLWLEQTDDFILQHLSTSPEVEPPHFVMQVLITNVNSSKRVCVYSCKIRILQ